MEGGDNAIGQNKAVVTIDDIDMQTSIVTYRTGMVYGPRAWYQTKSFSKGCTAVTEARSP